MKKPNFFIIGAPKSGTTAMSGYLGEHKNVYFCSPKEPCYFSEDFPGQCFVSSQEEYYSLFSGATDQHLALGEGSVWYMYSDVAVKKIYEYDKDAKLIIMLRNPVEQVYSMHQELYHRRYEIEPDFTKAWGLQKERETGPIPKYCLAREFLQYGAIALYADQVSKVLNVFPKEQVKIVLFDDFKSDTRKVYLDILQFLGIEDDGRTEFLPSLESRRHKWHWLGTFLINQPTWLNGIKSGVKKVFGIKRLGVRDMVAKHNTVKEKRKALPDEFTNELKDYFRDDVEKLAGILKRDLNHWCK